MLHKLFSGNKSNGTHTNGDSHDKSNMPVDGDSHDKSNMPVDDLPSLEFPKTVTEKDTPHSNGTSDVKEDKENVEKEEKSEVKDAEEETNSDDSDDSNKHGKYYSQRVTRKATGSLPKEPVKTLLSETTVKAGDEKKAAKTVTRKPGHYVVIAPDCTACGSDVILRPFKRNMLIHPILKTVICRQCHEFYHSDVFELDEEGSEIYCVWCGEGGELIYCEKCEKAYCSDCIKRNFGKKKKDQIMMDDNWRCFLCIPGSLKKQHDISHLVCKYQNLCIKDTKLIELFECEVKKSEMDEFNSNDYRAIVSDKIKERHTAQLMSLSQQKEESQAEFPPDHIFSESDEEEAKSEKSESNSDDDDFEAVLKESKGKKRKEKSSSDSDAEKKPKKEKKEGSTDDESDDEAFIELLRKKSKKRDPKEKDPSKKKDYHGVKKERKVKSDTSSKSSSKNGSDNSEEEGSDDSLFTTGNPLVSTRRLRKKLDSDSEAEMAVGESDDDDELMKKYKNKLSEYKDVGSDKESDFKPETSDSSEAEEEVASEAKSSNTDKSSSDEDGSEKKTKEDKSTAEDAEEKPKKKRKRKKKKGSADTESEEDDESPKKKKRKKKKKKGSDESSSSSDSDAGEEKKKREKGKRHDIRKVMSKNKLKKETVLAQEAEEKRRLKLKEKAMPSAATKLTNFVLEDLRKQKHRSKPITFEDQDECRVIEVHKALKKKLKPHQLDGIQFMYDCCIESVAKVKAGEPGSGCILAHCMGLGKTLQVITFLTTMLEYHHILGLKRMLVVCPLNTVRNWEAEFKKWLTHCDDPPEVSSLSFLFR